MTEGPQAYSPELRDAAAWSVLATDYYEKGMSRAARRALQSAVNLQPEEPRHLFKLARLVLETQDLHLLKGVSDTLATRFPNLGETHLIAGHLQKILGRTDLAVVAYRRALDAEPTSSNALFNLADLEPLQTGKLTAHMEALRRNDIASQDRANVCFALAKCYEAGGEFDRAFSCYEEANSAAADSMRKQGVHYDPIAVDLAASNTIAAYEPDTLTFLPEQLDLDFRMIFIVGLPRSGTTLVEQILASHPRVAAGGELPLVQECKREFERRGGEPSDVKLMVEMRERYIDGLTARDLEGSYITDKLPGNFAALGFIRRMFPDSIIVHCARHPIAVSWSLYTANFGSHEPYYNSFEYLVHYHSVYKRLMTHWRTALETPLVEVEYEHLVLNLELEARRLLTKCGLEWEPRCVEFHSFKRPIHTASQVQVRQPIYDTSISKWRHYEKHISYLTKHLGDPL